MKRIGILAASTLMLFSLFACDTLDSTSRGSLVSSVNVSDAMKDSTPKQVSELSTEEGSNNDLSDNQEIVLDEKGMIEVNMAIGDQVFATSFYDNESTRKIVSEMPFTLEMADYASQEKVANLAFELPPVSAETPATINAGDIYLWSGNSLVLFYTTFSNFYSYVPVGYIVDIEDFVKALGSGSVTVSFYLRTKGDMVDGT